MGRLIEIILEEIEYTLDYLEMYKDLGCQVPDAMIKHYNEVIEDCLLLHLTKKEREYKEDLTTKIHRVRQLKGKVKKISEY